jgi:hypothetical protein
MHAHDAGLLTRVRTRTRARRGEQGLEMEGTEPEAWRKRAGNMPPATAPPSQ